MHWLNWCDSKSHNMCDCKYNTCNTSDNQNVELDLFFQRNMHLGFFFFAVTLVLQTLCNNTTSMIVLNFSVICMSLDEIYIIEKSPCDLMYVCIVHVHHSIKIHPHSNSLDSFDFSHTECNVNINLSHVTNHSCLSHNVLHICYS